MRLLPLKSGDDLVQEYEGRCTRRIPLGAVVLAGYLAVSLIFAGTVKVYSAYVEQDQYAGLADGPYSY